MLTSQRKQHILSLLRREGSIVAKDLGAQLGLSEDSIRRDLRELAAQGLLKRVHGGALPVAAAEGDFARRMQLVPDRSVIRADGQDLSFVTVRIQDAAGGLVPRAKDRVKFELSGPGEIVATDNGDPTSFESFQAKEHAAFNGLVLVVVRTKAGETGGLILRATADGLAPAEIALTAQ